MELWGKHNTEIDYLVHQLNKETLAAAIRTDQTEIYKKFTDVLMYDATQDNSYISSLCDGTVMGATRSQHFRDTQELKSAIIRHAQELHKYNETSFSFYTLESTASRVEELWDAIKDESFIFGFKSVFAVQAHEKLNEIVAKSAWDVTKDVRRKLQDEKNRIINKLNAAKDADEKQDDRSFLK